MRCQLSGSLAFLVLATVAPADGRAQARPAADSALVARILLAEDRREPSSPAFAEGLAHGDSAIRLIARRAAARVRDPLFAARDSMPAPAAPPTYADPDWRLRYRALATKPIDCVALRTALSDSAWPVRLHAVDLVTPECAADSMLIRRLRAWALYPPVNGARRRGGVSWHPAAHAIVALARIAPARARTLLPKSASSRVPWLRAYAAYAAGLLADTATLRRLASDRNDNVREAAIDTLAKLSGHDADDVFIAALTSPAYQVVRAGARALKGSSRASAVVGASLAAAERLRADSSETSRDARTELLDRVTELADSVTARAAAPLGSDFDCEIARRAALIASASTRCARLSISLPPDAVALALGRDVRLRVTLADSSGGGSFVVRLRGDVAPIAAARVLELARAGWYNGRTWYRVEPDFVIQGGGPGSNEYVGHPRFIRDELGALPHLRGTVGMSTRGHDTGDAQWFVNLRDNKRLTRDYTAFGEVVSGIDVVDGILEGDVIARIDVVSPSAPRR